jgi:predicted dehydrogenase
MNEIVPTDAKTIRFGVIGCGGIGPTHCGAIRQIPGTELLAVADIVPERAASVAKKFDVPLTYASDVALLENPDIDAVCLCTPSGMHAEGTVRVLHAGKHVIVEKPMEVSLDACDRMITAQRETGKVLTVISQHRFDAASQIVKETIDLGKLGNIVLANAIVPWYRTQGYYDSGDWRGTWALDGGGALMNQGVHTVDLLQWLVSGQGRVSQIFGQTRTAAHERIEVEDVAAATLTFDNGTIGTLSATTAAYDGFAVRIEIYGTQGSAIIEGDRLKLLRLASGEEYRTEEAAAHALSVARGGTASVREDSTLRLGATEQESTLPNVASGAVWGDAHRAQFEDFLQAVRTGGTPLIDGPGARTPVEIILSLYRSARSGFPVTLA